MGNLYRKYHSEISYNAARLGGDASQSMEQCAKSNLTRELAEILRRDGMVSFVVEPTSDDQHDQQIRATMWVLDPRETSGLDQALAEAVEEERTRIMDYISVRGQEFQDASPRQVLSKIRGELEKRWDHE